LGGRRVIETNSRDNDLHRGGIERAPPAEPMRGLEVEATSVGTSRQNAIGVAATLVGQLGLDPVLICTAQVIRLEHRAARVDHAGLVELRMSIEHPASDLLCARRSVVLVAKVDVAAMAYCDVRDGHAVGADDDLVEDVGVDRRLNGPKDHRLAHEGLDVLAGDADGATAGRKNGHASHRARSRIAASVAPWPSM